MPEPLTPPSDPADMVDEYLQLCEDRHLDKARSFLAPNASLIFPGGRVFTSLDEMVRESGRQYRWVRKRRERYFVGGAGDGATTVTSLGLLYGEDLDGTPFSSIRYADVFIIRDGRIVEQHVYNDMAFGRLQSTTQHQAPAEP